MLAIMAKSNSYEKHTSFEEKRQVFLEMMKKNQRLMKGLQDYDKTGKHPRRTGGTIKHR